MDRAARDAAYDNSGAVVNSATLSTERNATSEAIRAAHPGALGPALRHGGAAEMGTCSRPRIRRRACLVFIHGGYWQRNGREGFAALAEGVRAHGWSVALPGYTLAPEASLAAIRRRNACRAGLAGGGGAGAWRGRPGAAVRLVGRRPTGGDGAVASACHGRVGDLGACTNWRHCGTPGLNDKLAADGRGGRDAVAAAAAGGG